MSMFVTDNLARRCLYLLFAFLTLVSQPASSDARIDELGRLFTDPAQREKLNAIRHGASGQQVESTSSVTEVTVNGVMLRSDGENVVWINGESSLDGAPITGISVNPSTANSENYKVQLMIDGKRVNIKPGQNWSEVTGTIKDNY